MPQKERLQDVFRRYIIATLGVCFVLLVLLALYHLRIVALLFAIAGLLAYIFAWPVNLLSRKINRTASVWITVVTGLILIGGFITSLVPIVSIQMQQLINTIPEILRNLESQAQNWRFSFMDRELLPYEHLQTVWKSVEDSAPEMLGSVFNYTQTIVSGTAAVVAAFLIIPLIMLYFLLDSHKLRAAALRLFPQKFQSDADRALHAVSRSLGSYILSRTLLALFVGVSYTLVLWAFGIPYAVLLGLLAFIGEFIPVIGPWLSFAPAALIVLAVAPVKLIPIAIVFILIQLAENYLIGPKLMGDTMDLHPLTVIAAMLIGGALGGVAGLFVAIPIAAVLKIILNIFVLRRKEPGIDMPKLDMIANNIGDSSNVDAH